MTRFVPSAAMVIAVGALITTLSIGIRQGFGLFLPPMTVDLGMGREAFALALAVQNLLWGAFQPLTGMIADRFGAGRVLAAGAAIYGAGLVVMAGAEGAADLHLGAGLLVGMGMACTGFGVVLGAVARKVTAERRSMALGMVTAGGSFGQLVLPPISQAFIGTQGWSGALISLAVIALIMAPLAVIMAGRASADDGTTAAQQTIAQALREAAGHSGYVYLTLGFFVCGFQVAFIAVHLPAYVADLGMGGGVAATCLALIGGFNIIGSFACGKLGDHYSKKKLLSLLYFLRAVAVAVLLVAPKTEMTVYLFSAAIGLLWLGTVPLTSGLVGLMFGVRYMSTLFGFVFFSHQAGSFLGIWLGGWLYDTTGTYDIVWIGCIVLGLAATVVHLPIREQPVARLSTP